MRYENVIPRIGSKEWLSNNYIIEIESNSIRNTWEWIRNSAWGWQLRFIKIDVRTSHNTLLIKQIGHYILTALRINIVIIFTFHITWTDVPKGHACLCKIRVGQKLGPGENYNGVGRNIGYVLIETDKLIFYLGWV